MTTGTTVFIWQFIMAIHTGRQLVECDTHISSSTWYQYRHNCIWRTGRIPERTSKPDRS